MAVSEARAEPDHATSYVITGALLLVSAGSMVAFLVGGVAATGPSGEGAGELFAELLVGVRIGVGLGPLGLGAYAWAITAGTAVVGVLALGRRPVARGGALVVAFLQLGVWLSIGYFVVVRPDSSSFGYVEPGEGVLDVYRGPGISGSLFPALAVLGLGFCALTLIFMARVPAPPRQTRRLSGVAGLGLLLYGALATPLAILALLGGLGAALHEPFAVLLGVAALVTAVLLLLGRPTARGAAIAVAMIAAYLTARPIVWLIVHGFSPFNGPLTALGLVVALITTVTVLVALLAPPRSPDEPMLSGQPTDDERAVLDATIGDAVALPFRFGRSLRTTETSLTLPDTETTVRARVHDVIDEVGVVVDGPDAAVDDAIGRADSVWGVVGSGVFGAALVHVHTTAGSTGGSLVHIRVTGHEGPFTRDASTRTATAIAEQLRLLGEADKAPS